ncbi:hypothetical protein EV179_004416 [Coemansia sp. RSA 487]|nr:hypothetical protein EV179_004416 [Coemansia sp. RSA 487]
MSDECNQIEQLQRLFELHFATRRIWLESILATMEPVCKAESVDRDIFLSILSETSTDIERMLAVIIGSIDEITSAREAQFTAKRWEALSESKDGSDALTTSSQPVVRCLTSMNSTIDTISAKLVVCRDTIELPGEEGTSGAQEVVPFNEVARVFASLKTDIDVLAGLYQEAMTSLTLDIDGPGSTEAVTLDQGKDHAQYTATDGIIDMSTIPDGAQVFGCTPFGTDDMDTSDLVFEADPSDEPLDRRQQRPAADRAERIGLQKQKREKEAQERRKAGEVHSMMNELRTAIGTRGKQKEATSD